MKRKGIAGFVLGATAMALLLTPTMARAGGATVWEDGDKKLQLSGHLRYRYEVQNDDSKSGDDASSRYRERIRVRFGAKYKVGDAMEAGLRLRSKASDLHSPHTTLGNNTNGGTAPTSSLQQFGLDRGYIKFNLQNGAYVALGKYKKVNEQLSSTWWEGDYNPEGIVAGFKTNGLNLAVARYQVQYNDYSAENDTAFLLGADYKGEVAGMDLKAVLQNLSFNPGGRDAAEKVGGGSALAAMPGSVDGTKSTSYTMVGAELKPISPLKVGLEVYSGNVDNAVDANLKSSDKSGMVAYVRYKINDTFGVRYYYTDAGYASVPLLGAWGSDDFPYTSNYKGSRFQLDIDTGLGVEVDIRYFTMKTKNDALSTDGRTESMSGSRSVNRVQLNFNVPF